MPAPLQLNSVTSIGQSHSFSFYKTSLNLLKVALFFVVFFTCSTTAQAQYTESSTNGSSLGLAFGAGIDVPLHNLNDIYKATPSFDIGFTKGFRNFVFGIHGGYRSYQPKQGYSYADQNNTDNLLSSGLYSNYSVVAIYGSASYNVDLNGGAVFYSGLNIGSYYTSYSYYYDNGAYTDNEHDANGYAYVAPKLGVSFALGDNLHLGIEARYNLFGSANYNYNTAYGSYGSSVLYTSFNAGATLNYQF